MMYTRAALALLLAAWLLQACEGARAIPRLDLELWSGDSMRASVRRKQQNLEISCADRRLDGMVCMTYGDLREVYELLQKCERWPDGTVLMGQSDARRLLRRDEAARRVMRESYGLSD